MDILSLQQALKYPKPAACKYNLLAEFDDIEEENGLCGLASALVRLGGNRDKIGLMDCGMQPARSAQSKEDRDNTQHVRPRVRWSVLRFSDTSIMADKFLGNDDLSLPKGEHLCNSSVPSLPEAAPVS